MVTNNAGQIDLVSPATNKNKKRIRIDSEENIKFLIFSSGKFKAVATVNIFAKATVRLKRISSICLFQRI